jgi:AraC-like DNA-binding protein
MSLEEVAVSCRFTSSEILRRAFERRLDVTPRQYRASFWARTGAVILSCRLAGIVVSLFLIAWSSRIDACIQNHI